MDEFEALRDLSPEDLDTIRGMELERVCDTGGEVTRSATMELERQGKRPDNEIPATLATDGEASDGHILSIPGVRMPEGGRMPALLGHQSTSDIPALGSWGELRRQRGTPARLRGVARFNLDEDGLMPARRGVLNLVRAGDITGVSLRWRGLDVVPRTSLPKGHPARVDDDGPSPQRFGAFFKTSSPLEASFVDAGADSQALVGRAAEEGPLTELWIRSLDLPGMDAPAKWERQLLAAVLGLREEGLEDQALAAIVARVMGPEAAQAELVRYAYVEGEKVSEAWLPQAALDALRGPNLAGLTAPILERLAALERKIDAERQSPAPLPAPIPAPAPRSDSLLAMAPPAFARLVAETMTAQLAELQAGRVR